MHQSEQSLQQVIQVNSHTGSVSTKKGSSTDKSTEKKSLTTLPTSHAYLFKEREKMQLPPTPADTAHSKQRDQVSLLGV